MAHDGLANPLNQSKHLFCSLPSRYNGGIHVH